MTIPRFVLLKNQQGIQLIYFCLIVQICQRIKTSLATSFKIKELFHDSFLSRLSISYINKSWTCYRTSDLNYQ